MRRSSTVYVKKTSNDILESLHKLRIRESAQLQNRFGFLRHVDSSSDISSQLSKVESNGEEEYRSETSITKFWRWTWET